ncbi:MAG: ATP-dependent zinc metalloprotease FtsH [Lachnospiraceae bacterium]|nr:ATP-dependent zinc metalloprotease FtsH [Lachnospiraceae bacterium]
MEGERKSRGLLYLIIAAIIFFGFFMYNRMRDTALVDAEYNLKVLQQDIEKGKVEEVHVYPGSTTPNGEVKVVFNSKEKIADKSFYVSDVGRVEEILVGIDKDGFSYTVHKVESEFSGFKVLIIIEIVMLVLFILFMIAGLPSMRMNQGGNDRMMNFGKSRATRIDPDDESAKRFDDVAGLMEEKEELEEVVNFLREPNKYTSVGARIPKGMILVGPPGTGKTLLAKAVAGEAGVPFFSLSGSDFVEMFVGVGASRVRDMFSEAKKNAPCIIFIDEIDAVARKRGSGLGGGHDEREQTLNQLLVEMDGFGVNQGIIVMAATNRVDILDPAILRPGRFDRRISVGRPDVRGREEILQVHAKGKPLADDVDLKKVAHTTVGFTGADLENLLNEAAIACAKEGRQYVTEEDISKSFIKLGIGTEKKSRIVSERDRKITAYHESGHAILFHVLPDVGPVHIVSIIPTGHGAAGYTMPIDENDDMFVTRGQMLQEIKVDLGGRIAESLIFDDITTGASQDIKQATETARNMVTKFGFSDVVGMVNYADEDEVFVGRDYGHTSKAYSDGVATSIDMEVKKIIDECYRDAKRILEENIDILHKSANLLLEKERITRQEFEALFEE